MASSKERKLVIIDANMTLSPLKQGVSRLHKESELSPPKAGGACLSPLRGGSKPTPM